MIFSTFSFLVLLMLLIAQLHAASSDRLWSQSCETLADFQAVKSFTTRSVTECICTAGATSQLVDFEPTSRLCTQYSMQQGRIRKCRDANKGDQLVWAASDCWITVQHRVSGSVDFYRNWTQYQSEFGDGPDRNYWIGLNALHALTSARQRKLRFLMKPWNGSESWAEYSSFSVGPESDKYRLSVSGFSGSPGIGDSFQSHSGFQFSTMDAEHDTSVTHNCAQTYNGAWWFGSCFVVHANGQYKNETEAINGPYAQGLIWFSPFGHFYSLKEVEMLVQ